MPTRSAGPVMMVQWRILPVKYMKPYYSWTQVHPASKQLAKRDTHRLSSVSKGTSTPVQNHEGGTTTKRSNFVTYRRKRSILDSVSGGGQTVEGVMAKPKRLSRLKKSNSDLKTNGTARIRILKRTVRVDSSGTNLGRAPGDKTVIRKQGETKKQISRDMVTKKSLVMIHRKDDDNKGSGQLDTNEPMQLMILKEKNSGGFNKIQGEKPDQMSKFSKGRGKGERKIAFPEPPENVRRSQQTINVINSRKPFQISIQQFIRQIPKKKNKDKTLGRKQKKADSGIDMNKYKGTKKSIFYFKANQKTKAR